MIDKKIYTKKDVCRILNVKPYQINYLFDAGLLNRDEFQMIARNRIFYEEDLDKIRNALDKVAIRG